MFDMSRGHLPTAAGVGFKPQHYNEIISAPGAVRWVEVHAENYMGDGGRPLAQLRALSERMPISVHGVGLSIGGSDPLDQDHLDRLKHLLGWLQPASFSEHLAWSSHGGVYFNDLLPLPYTAKTLARVVDHIDAVQETLGRRMLLENPSVYVGFDETDMEETDFLAEIVRRTGCGLLLDINNVFVSCTNQCRDPHDYLAQFPLGAVGEVHLGGHDADEDLDGTPLLIDAHGSEVVDPVWALYEETITRMGPKPTLIEWDNNIPDWDMLEEEAARAGTILRGAHVT